MLALLNILFAVLNASIEEFLFDGLSLVLFYIREEPKDVNNFAKIFILLFEFVLNAFFLLFITVALVGFLYIEYKYDK